MVDVALYARLSVTTEESVSIERQLEAGRRYAAARGWTVVLEARDEGISATRSRPEDRVGWRTILDAKEQLDAVIVWKVDRLARRVLDFLHADEALRARGAGIVAVEDPIDMTSPTGRAFATMLAVFGEMEAAAISSRVRAARETLIRTGRRAGGRPPYGWLNMPNPDGPGMVLAKDPERIGVVVRLAAMGLDGASLYSMVKWLESEAIHPRPRRAPQADPAGSADSTPRWHAASVEAILRQPALAGMTSYHGDVLRGADGLPVVDESIAILSTAEYRKLGAMLGAAKKPGSRQKAGTEPALLYGIVRCASCDGLMYRATAARKYRQYRCQHRDCPRQVGITREALEAHVVAEVLAERGAEPTLMVTEISTGENAERLADVEAAISQTLEQLGRDNADVLALTQRLATLKEVRTEVRGGKGVQRVYRVSPTSLCEMWEAAESPEERRQLLRGVLDSVKVKPGGGRGRAFDPFRVELRWRQPTAEEVATSERRDNVPVLGALLRATRGADSRR